MAAQAEKMRQLDELLNNAKADDHYDLSAFQERRCAARGGSNLIDIKPRRLTSYVPVSLYFFSLSALAATISLTSVTHWWKVHRRARTCSRYVPRLAGRPLPSHCASLSPTTVPTRPRDNSTNGSAM